MLKEVPYGTDKFVVKRPEVNTVYLDDEELKRIDNLRSKLSKKMQINLDRFLFSCYTGFRYSDMVSVKWNNVKNNGTLRKKMVKTNKEVVVPITPIVKDIINRYEGKPNDLIFPHISNNKINKAIKTICKMARIDKKISFHIARHTFGYILGKEGVNAFKIMELMGHSNVKQTMRYVKASLQDLTNAMNSISLFKKAS